MGNDPINRIDPDGSLAWPPFIQRALNSWNRLNSAERNLVINNPNIWAGLRVYRNQVAAEEMTEQRFGDNFRNDASDAFRHTFWQALNAKTIGEGEAKKFSMAHELSTPKGEELDMLMDFHNNAVGIELGKSPNALGATNNEIANMVMELLNSGKLLIIKQGALMKSNGKSLEADFVPQGLDKSIWEENLNTAKRYDEE